MIGNIIYRECMLETCLELIVMSTFSYLRKDCVPFVEVAITEYKLSSHLYVSLTCKEALLH
jgi:hypothetical protein